MQADKIKQFELFNEPTNFPPARWDNSTAAFVQQWKDWTGRIDAEVKAGKEKWWASSATTDKTGLYVRPADLIPAAFATCDPARDALDTIANILNHTRLVEYADVEIVPSARAAQAEGKSWLIGEYNSVACSGKQNVTDTFAQALWTVDTDLIYAERNASQVTLHQGATLVFQSDQQSNTAGEDGTPGFSAFSLLYPVDSSKRGKARVNPGFVGQLFVAEALRNERVASLPTSVGLDKDIFSSYAFFEADSGKLRRIAAINLEPYYSENETQNHTVHLDLSNLVPECARGKEVWLKRMMAPSVDELDTQKVKWAGQSFPLGKAVGSTEVERVRKDAKIKVRGSEAVLVFFHEENVYRDD